MHFYQLLKPLSIVEGLSNDYLMDWGQDHIYNQEIGIGECAGVIMDVVGTIINDAKDRLAFAKKAFLNRDFGDSIYFSYASILVASKALLLSEDIKCNTHKKILSDFNTVFIKTGKLNFKGDFEEFVLQFSKLAPSLEFSKDYLQRASGFLSECIKYQIHSREKPALDKTVVDSYYKA